MHPISAEDRVAEAAQSRSHLAVALAHICHPRDFRQLYGSPEGPGWRSFADVIGDEDALAAWFQAENERYRGRDEVSGSLLSLRLAGPVIDMAVSLLIFKGWALALPADGLMLAFGEHGAATGVALRHPGIEHEDAAGQDELLYSALAEQLEPLLQAGFVALKKRTRYGLRGMWGQAADQIAGIAARRARLLGLDQPRAWQAASRLIDALAARQPLVRTRPRPFASTWPAGAATIAVKGSCCLYFKVSSQTDDRRYCSNCPLLADEVRAARTAELLAREHDRLCPQQSAA